jgi:hypothetical protein
MRGGPTGSDRSEGKTPQGVPREQETVGVHTPRQQSRASRTAEDQCGSACRVRRWQPTCSARTPAASSGLWCIDSLHADARSNRARRPQCDAWAEQCLDTPADPSFRGESESHGVQNPADSQFRCCVLPPDRCHVAGSGQADDLQFSHSSLIRGSPPGPHPAAAHNPLFA